jgi:hypothetical protein
MKWMLVGMVAVISMLDVAAGRNGAQACNRTAGCAMDSFREDYDMKHDGRMDEAMKAGRENMEAFRAMQAGQQKGSAKK